jgi:hypothetical protein
VLDHYDVRSGSFDLGIRPPAGPKPSFSFLRALRLLLVSAAELNAEVYAMRHCPQTWARATHA